MKIFFWLTIILTLPAYVLVALTSKAVILSPEMAFAFVPLSALAPIGAALILTFRKHRWAGAKRLLSRSFDYKRIANRIWYVPTLFLAPLLVFLSLGIAILAGLPLVNALFPVIAAPAMVLFFFGGAVGEEVGWMGYAFKPMQARWNTLPAAILLGLLVAVWHVPLFYYLIDDPVMLAAQLLFPIVLRLLLVWVFCNTGESIFAATLFHTMNNVAFAVLPVNTVVSTVVYAVASIIVTVLWGAATMANFRWAKG